jgi:phosphatidylserine/phosphatidylglycerophosphate/cardiolipin synthase-like enzyme
MRTAAHNGDLSLHLISGPHVVMLAMNWPEARQNELMGFAIYRTNLQSGAGDWIYGQKNFPGAISPNPGAKYSTRLAPVQSFSWGDYTPRPGVRYRYRVLALGGAPGALTELAFVEAEIDCPTTTPSGHAINFNRGAVAAQEYARRFNNQHPESVANGEALTWLTRGLLESALAFVRRATGAGMSLHVAIYEARYPPILNELKVARDRGVDVHVVFDAKDNASGDDEAFPREENLSHLDDAGLLASGCTQRTANPSYIAHNKFIVLSNNGVAQAVWTGSTNWSLNGFMGQLNAAHVVDSASLAAKYLDYWNLLAGNPTGQHLRPNVATLSPVPAAAVNPSLVPVFSPQTGRAALDHYISLATGAKAVMVTFAFSIDTSFADVLKVDDDSLRYVLMDGIKGNNLQKAKIAQAVKEMRASPATQVAIGAYVRENALDNWLVETSNMMATHVQFVHTKFLIIDPLGAQPVVVTGSANFSEPSCNENDENMLIVAGDPDVADVYLGEFMRTYAHYAYRDAREAARLAGHDFALRPLAETPAWTGPYYQAGNFKRRQREYFAAP